MSNEADDICKVECVHPEAVNLVQSKMDDDASLQDLSALFKILGDHTRIRILHALLISELCVCDLVTILNMSQSAVSHQLRVLRNGKVIKYRKDGKNVFYSLDDEHIAILLQQGMAHVRE